VMSLTKLGPSGWRYFAEEIATGREDYFARSAEHPGRYLGRGSEVSLGPAGLPNRLRDSRAPGPLGGSVAHGVSINWTRSQLKSPRPSDRQPPVGDTFSG